MSVPPRVARILTPPSFMSNTGSSLEGGSGTASASASQALAARTSLHQCGLQQQDKTTTPNSNSTGNKTNKIGLSSSLGSHANAAGGASSSAASTGATTTTTTNSHQQQFQHSQRHMTLHPVLPRVAYVLEPVAAARSATQKVLVVQDTTTHDVLWNVPWMDVAACLYYSEQDAQKLPSAAKSLGLIVALEFVDYLTLYWSGMTPQNASAAPTASPGSSSSYLPTSAYLLVQTTHRCLILHLRQSPYSNCVVWTQSEPSARALSRQALLYAHMEPTVTNAESTTTATATAATTNKILPSSNWLPLSDTLYLVGCTDGSLQCWNAPLGQVVRQIRGLGGGNSSGGAADWITILKAANPYHAQLQQQANNSNSTVMQFGTTDNGGVSSETTTPALQRRRIMAVTKKGMAYLMEIEWQSVAAPITVDDDEDEEAMTTMTIEIKPPLAKFVGGAGSLKSNSDAALMEHQLIQYDAHRDWILWLHPAMSSASSSSKSKSGSTTTNATTLLVWNLKALEKEIISHIAGGSKSFLVPDPTLTVQFPAAPEDTVLTVLPALSHTAFHEDTVICAVATTTGEFWFQAASMRSRNTTASPIVGVSLSDLVQTGAGLDHAPAVRIHSMATQPLGDTPALMVATNLGLVVLDMPSDTGDRHMHLGAGLGTFGKSVLSVRNSELMYASLDVLKANPYGLMEPKNAVTVYESPPPAHLPMDYHKRPFRLAPNFLPSPSGLYVCLFNSGEYQYEILHLPTLLQRVGQQRGSSTAGGSKPLVASGTGIASFAWVGDEDCFAILHAEEWMNEASLLMSAASAMASTEAASAPSSSLLAGVTSTTKMVGGAAALVGGATLNLTKAAKSTTMAAATGATKAATMATTTATKTAVSGLKKGAKLATFGVFSKKKKKGGDDDTEADMGMSAMTEDIDEAGPSLEMFQVGAPLPVDATGPTVRVKTKKRFVELKSLIAIETSGDLAVGSVAAATSSSLGNLMLRGGGQNLPVALFGGPVLCVASQTDGNDTGSAHFYTLKPDDKEKQASLFVSSGPALPFPDLCIWDDDGLLCAIVLGNRVSIYISQVPEFVLLGCVRLGSSLAILNAKFIHGVLYCCTWNSVHCVLMGDLEDGNVCSMDCYTLATSVINGVPKTPLTDGEYRSFAPSCIALPLIQPSVLGYQNGSLLISTARGVFALPLTHPILRIGLLLASGQVERAVKWFDAFPDHDHDSLAVFLERRGHFGLAVAHYKALSLETAIDLSMRHGLIDRLCELVDHFGVKGIRAVDLGRGYSNGGMFGPEFEVQSLAVCVAAFLLAHGKVELVRQMTSELLRLDDGRKDALLLASLMLHANEADATRLMTRAVEVDQGSDWDVGIFVRDHVLN